MKKLSWNYYGVKLIYQAHITGKPIPERVDEDYTDDNTFFEESIMLVKAQSFEDAYKTAEKNAAKDRRRHTNVYGQIVEWVLVEAINCYLIGDSLEPGTELYSAIMPISEDVTTENFLEQKYNFSLENDEINDQRKEERISKQKVLTYEEFSKWKKNDRLSLGGS